MHTSYTVGIALHAWQNMNSQTMEMEIRARRRSFESWSELRTLANDRRAGKKEESGMYITRAK